MPVHVISGVSIGDTVFTTDPAIFGIDVTWNVTRIQRDADAGKFGKPETVPVSALPPMSSLANANIDWVKVHAMIQQYNDGVPDAIVLKPSLQVMVPIGKLFYRIPVDGNHRICARRVLGMTDFAFYCVPASLERRYRVTGLPSMSGGQSVGIQ